MGIDNRSSRKDVVLDKAIADGQIAMAQAEAESAWVANNLESDSDRQRKVHQAHLEFITRIVNDGVKNDGVDWLGDYNPYVDTLLALARIRGLKVTEQNIIDRFTNEGLVDVDAETERQQSDNEQVNDAGANKVNVRV